jgi:hypothetical protein
MTRIMVKLGDYEAMGIRTIRVINPKTGLISRFQNGRLDRLKLSSTCFPTARIRSTGTRSKSCWTCSG